MWNYRQISLPSRAGGKPGIWLALTVAIILHVIFLVLPVSRQIPVTQRVSAPIELHLTVFSQIPSRQPETMAKGPLPETVSESAAETSDSHFEPQTEPAAPLLLKAPPLPDLQYTPEIPDRQETARLTSIILSRQFIPEESVTDKLFGRQTWQYTPELQKDFHFPVRQNMIEMLDQPMPDLPFAYTPGLVRFAYEPGIKGDLQRFWDVITPEFGWRTNNGTEFRCIWLIVIAGCGWK